MDERNDYNSIPIQPKSIRLDNMNINEIKPNQNNPRIIKDDKFKKLVKSIQDFPQMLELRPIVIDENNIVLGGNMRLKACIKAGLKDVPVKQAKELTEEQKKEFIVKDNVGYGEWDWDDLANNWDEQLLTEWGLDIPNFDATVLEAEEDGFSAPEGGIETDIVLGDLFEIGEHRLLCGDSTDSDQVAKLMNGQKADMVFTDPPYNIDFKGTMGYTSKDGVMISMSNGYNAANSKFDDIKNDKKDKEEFNKFIKDIISNFDLFLIGAWYISFSSKNINEILNPLLELNKEWKSIIIWNKNQSSMGGGHFKKKYEPIIYGYEENKFYGKEYGEEDVWDIQRTLKNDLHPTMKPVALIEKAINISSLTNNIVLDFFLGSGSTMVASHQLKRKCYGMELDPKYCQVIIDRMKKLDPTLIIKKNGVIL
jgi:DNA modification methylase